MASHRSAKLAADSPSPNAAVRRKAGAESAAKARHNAVSMPHSVTASAMRGQARTLLDAAGVSP